MSTAQLAYTFTLAYWKQHKQFPKMPIPLFVWKLADSDRDHHLAVSQKFYGDMTQLSAWNAANKNAQSGLAVFAYYYPGSSIRLAHFMGWYPGAEAGQWRNRVRVSNFEVNRTITNWISPLVNIVRCGYLPTSLPFAGNCLQEQNLTIDRWRDV